MVLAWEILNMIAMYQMGYWWVLYPFPCDVLAVYLLGTPALAPSVRGQLDQHLQGPVHRPLFLNQMSPQFSQTPRQNSPEGSLQRRPSHWWLAYNATMQLQTRKVHQVHLTRTHWTTRIHQGLAWLVVGFVKGLVRPGDRGGTCV